MATMHFDASGVDPARPNEPVPTDWYLCVIEDSRTKGTKNGTGRYLELELQIIDGPHKGRKLWDRLNLWNPNQQAVDIAQRTLSAICHAVGVLKISDSQELHALPLLVRAVYVEQEGFPPKNEIKGYKAHTAAAPAPGAPAPGPAAAPPASAPPWARKATGKAA